MLNIHEYKSLFKNKSFVKLWLAVFLSMLGDYVFSISLYIWVYGSTGSVVALSSSIFFQFLPRLIGLCNRFFHSRYNWVIMES